MAAALNARKVTANFHKKEIAIIRHPPAAGPTKAPAKNHPWWRSIRIGINLQAPSKYSTRVKSL